MYNITTDPIEIISGTSNTSHPVYVEARKIIDSDSSKTDEHLKSFLHSLDAVEKKAGSDNRLSSSRGNVSKFVGYDNIQVSIKFLDKHIPSNSMYKDLKTIYECLENYSNIYTEAYDKSVRLVISEYESALHLLVMGLTWCTANYLEMGCDRNGRTVIKKKAGYNSPVLSKLAKDMAKKLKSSDHRAYIQFMVKHSRSVKTESVYTEGNLMDAYNIFASVTHGAGKLINTSRSIFRTVKRSMFGIIPLIRICLYFRYKRKADTVLALEQQAAFIRMNIEQLQNIKNMDPVKKAEIIKKQEAIIEAYNKKAEKLRAELSTTETEVATAIKQDDSSVKKDSSGSSDDFKLESSGYDEVVIRHGGKKYILNTAPVDVEMGPNGKYIVPKKYIKNENRTFLYRHIHYRLPNNYKELETLLMLFKFVYNDLPHKDKNGNYANTIKEFLKEVEEKMQKVKTAEEKRKKDDEDKFDF